MSEKRFKYGRAFPINSDDSLPCITDIEKDKDYFRMSDIVNVLNEQQSIINKKKELLKLIAKACTYSKEHSVKEILRKEIRAIDTVTGESANAWHDYVLLSEFFEECYGEHWDNFD